MPAADREERRARFGREPVPARGLHERDLISAHAKVRLRWDRAASISPITSALKAVAIGVPRIGRSQGIGPASHETDYSPAGAELILAGGVGPHVFSIVGAFVALIATRQTAA
jgi:hypothetical protein